jgi:uncharacterized protein (TIGR00369 family)
MAETIERDNFCFCCGADNPRGLHLVITHPEKGSAETTLEVPTWFSGWKQMTHGGFLTTILDEIMAYACIALGQAAVTGEITVRFNKPVRVGTRIKAVGKVEQSRGRIISTRGRIYDADGAVAAEASARFIIPGRTSPSSAPASSG